MLWVFWLLFLLSLAAKGSKDTECRAIDGKNLQCKFPENINSTRKDFTVYFYPATGGEEKVVDCAWINEQLHCIRQEGFECNQPVSENAIIGVPTRFVNRTGSYRCNTNGSRPGVISSCRFNESQAIVATFTKSECQRSSSECLHQPGDSQDMFRVKLDVTGYPHGEYICHPDSSFPQLKGQGCMVSKDEETDSPSIPVVAVILPVTGVVSAASVVGIVFIIRRKNTRKRNEDAKVEETEKFEVVT